MNGVQAWALASGSQPGPLSATLLRGEVGDLVFLPVPTVRRPFRAMSASWSTRRST